MSSSSERSPGVVPKAWPRDAEGRPTGAGFGDLDPDRLLAEEPER